MQIVRNTTPRTPQQRRRARVWNVAWVLFIAVLLAACWRIYYGG